MSNLALTARASDSPLIIPLFPAINEMGSRAPVLAIRDPSSEPPPDPVEPVPMVFSKEEPRAGEQCPGCRCFMEVSRARGLTVERPCARFVYPDAQFLGEQ